MTTVAPPPVRPSHKRSRLVTVVSITLLIAGLAIGLLLAFSSGGTSGSSVDPAPSGASISVNPPTERPCLANPPEPC